LCDQTETVGQASHLLSEAATQMLDRRYAYPTYAAWPSSVTASGCTRSKRKVDGSRLAEYADAD